MILRWVNPHLPVAATSVLDGGGQVKAICIVVGIACLQMEPQSVHMPNASGFCTARTLGRTR